jgi:tetrahydromethanopterin S-methyltransferase subunit B
LETNQITEQIEEFDNYFEDILHLLDESDNTGQTINLDLNGNSTLDFNPSASK